MNLNEIVEKLRKYPAFSVEVNGKPANGEKQVYTDNVDIAEYLAELSDNFKKFTVIPRTRLGNAYIKDTENAMIYTQENTPTVPIAPIAPVEPLGAVSGSNEFYRILWEQERANAREYKDKYERAYEDLHKREIELVESKNSNNIGASVMQGLGSIAPMFIGGGGVGELPSQQEAQREAKVLDRKMSQVVKLYSKQNEEVKQKLTKLFANIFSQINLIDDFIEITNKQ